MRREKDVMILTGAGQIRKIAKALTGTTPVYTSLNSGK